MNAQSLSEFTAPSSGTTVALGFFDGVHLGHQRLMAQARTLAESGCLPVAFTFRNHPATVVGKVSPPLLTTFEERCQILSDLGMQVVWTDFNVEFSQQSPALFIQQVLVQRLAAVAVVTGDNYRFGHKAAGNPKLLQLSSQFRSTVVPDVVFADQIISSSRIRQAVAQGQVELVREMLGRCYRVTNEVIHGQQLGRELGMPTANLLCPAQKAAPGEGVYAVRALVEGRGYGGVASFGSRPTLEASQTPEPLLEVHLLDFSGDLYGRSLTVEFHSFLRGQERFEGLEALKLQMHRDSDEARRRLGNSG